MSEEWDLAETDLVVTMVTARMVWFKGIKKFIEAPEILAQEHGNVKFILIVPMVESSLENIPGEYLRGKISPNLKLLLGFRTDIREIIMLSNVVALPSNYGENFPRVLLEALALQNPLLPLIAWAVKRWLDTKKMGT